MQSEIFDEKKANYGTKDGILNNGTTIVILHKIFIMWKNIKHLFIARKTRKTFFHGSKMAYSITVYTA